MLHWTPRRTSVARGWGSPMQQLVKLPWEARRLPSLRSGAPDRRVPEQHRRGMAPESTEPTEKVMGTDLLLKQATEMLKKSEAQMEQLSNRRSEHLMELSMQWPEQLRKLSR